MSSRKASEVCTLNLVDSITREKVKSGSVGVWWLGQAGYAYKFGDKVVYLDPYLSDLVKLTRLVPPPMPPIEINNADIVLVTHDHDDHADNGTLPFIALASTQAVFVGPKSSTKKMLEWGIPEDRVLNIVRGKERTIRGIRVIATNAVHTQDSVGYVIQGNGVSLYHTGDTLFFLSLKDIGNTFDLDCAFIPINGKWGNFGASEALIVTDMLHPKVVVPMHYGMFKENTVDPRLFVDACRKKFPRLKVEQIKHGGKFIYNRDQKKPLT
jgi:L-ascorbate 6-phosphate lactonase